MDVALKVSAPSSNESKAEKIASFFDGLCCSLSILASDFTEKTTAQLRSLKENLCCEKEQRPTE
jgi:hypothetical protein